MRVCEIFAASRQWRPCDGAPDVYEVRIVEMQRRFHLTRGELFAYRVGSGRRENWVSRWVLPRAPGLARNVRAAAALAGWLWRAVRGLTGPEVARTAHGGLPGRKRPFGSEAADEPRRGTWERYRSSPGGHWTFPSDFAVHDFVGRTHSDTARDRGGRPMVGVDMSDDLFHAHVRKFSQQESGGC